MIRVIYEPRIPSTHIKDEIWYPEINRKADEYYGYLYHEAGRAKGLTVITYSPFILEALENIAKERNLKLVVEVNDKEYIKDFEDVYYIHGKLIQDFENKEWELKKNEW